MESELRQITVAANQNRVNVSQYTDMLGRNLIISGEFLMPTTGEVIVTVNFPVTFTEKPLFYFGADLDPNQEIVVGVLPICNGMVIRYNIDTSDVYTTLWKGADLGFVTQGTPGQKINCHWHFIGKGIFNPITPIDNVDGTI